MLVKVRTPEDERPVARVLNQHYRARYPDAEVAVFTGSRHREDLQQEIRQDFRMFDVILFLTDRRQISAVEKLFAVGFGFF